jgi:hypothetical protein
VSYITLLEAAQHLRLADTLEEADALPDKDILNVYITAAAEVVENYINQPLTGFEAVPFSLKSAMLLLIGHLYENREEVTVGVNANQLPKASEYLMNPYRVML